MERLTGIYVGEGWNMKRKKKPFTKNPPEREIVAISTPPKTLAQRLGITAEILLGEPKITITGDYLVEITNHKGIISLSEEQIEENTRKYV